MPQAKRSASRRKQETLGACGELHGATDTDQSPAFDGMWATLINGSSPLRLASYISYSAKARKKVLPVVVKKEINQFAASKDNLKRSIKVLYSGGLLSKEKYKSIRTNLTMTNSSTAKGKCSIKIMPSVSLPKLVPYNKLINYIKTIDFNVNTIDMAPEFCTGLPNSEEVNGAYRELEEFILKLAEMFIVIDQALGSKSFFNHLGSDKYHFKLATGADGAPFGKDDEATAWLISCLNVASHIATPNRNFLIAGANCSETHVCMQRYARKLVNDMNSMTSKSYKVMDFDVKVSFELLPSDMKWLAFMGGELSNAAFYFSPFGNVNDDTKSTVNGTLGKGGQNTWQPWPYDKRLEIAAKVSNLK